MACFSSLLVCLYCRQLCGRSLCPSEKDVRRSKVCGKWTSLLDCSKCVIRELLVWKMIALQTFTDCFGVERHFCRNPRPVSQVQWPVSCLLLPPQRSETFRHHKKMEWDKTLKRKSILILNKFLLINEWVILLWVELCGPWHLSVFREIDGKPLAQV